MDKELTAVLSASILLLLSSLLWTIDGEGTLDEIIAEALPVFQERCDEYNETEEIEWTIEDDFDDNMLHFRRRKLCQRFVVGR